MKSSFYALLGLPGIALAGLVFALPHPTNAAKAPAPAALRSGTLLRFDFTDPAAWPAKKASGNGSTVTAAKVGTIDVQGTTEPSGGILLSAKSANGGFASGLLPVTNRETNLGKLTLAFSLSASTNRPVTVRVESFSAAKKRTGGLQTQIFPAAPDFYQRFALDLSTLKPTGAGRFQPTDPFIQVSFVGSDVPNAEIRLDNVSYATPAFYVSPGGSDTNDGRSEKTAFATPQKAVDAAGQGDIIVLMDGTYNGGQGNVVSFRRAGAPDAWIVLKNYPGQKPTLTSNGWNIVSIASGSKEKPDTETELAYLEIRGLHVRGEGDVAGKKYPEAMNKSDSRTNSNGIAADGRYMKKIPHHLRFADNLVEYCPAQGLGALESDWVTIENNTSRYNCWTTIYATSGISLLGYVNFDATDNVYKLLIRNNVCYRNETYQIWQQVNRVSDGNGIILDVNQGPDPNGGPTVHPASKYIGRTLVQNNLCFDNGGSGIHTVRADRVDIIGNTAYLNSASKSLQYSQIYTYGSEDVRIMNNILVAPVADVAAGEKPEPVNKISGPNKNVVFSHNVYYGGNIAPTLGDGDVVADPGFVRPTRDGKIADFHLKPGSPALNKGIVTTFLPYLDLDGKPRLPNPSRGVYQR